MTSQCANSLWGKVKIMEIDLPAMMCNKRRSGQVYTSFSESLSPTQVQVSGFKLQIPKTQAKIQLASSKLRTSNSELRTPKRSYSSSVLNFSNTERSSSVVTSPATDPLVASS